MEPKEFCPAAGQGALGIETRKDDVATIAAVAFLDDAATRFAVTVERAALAALGGGCQVPIGIYCRPWMNQSEELWDEIYGVVADPVTGTQVRVFHTVHHWEKDASTLGRETAEMLMEVGAGPLLSASSDGGRQ